MTYQALNNASVITYINNTPVLKAYFGSEPLLSEEIGDGNLNSVFRVRTVSASLPKQLILKQALPYLRCVGEGYPLAKERMLYEVASLKQFAQVTPQFTPKIHHTDDAMCLVAMQYLHAHCILRKGMLNQIQYPQFADHISTFLAENCFKTSSLTLTSVEKNQLIRQFNSNPLRELTENFVFTYPFQPHTTNHIRPSLQKTAETLWADSEFKTHVLHLKQLFMNQTDALLHADLHTGSILLNEEETFCIDSEFAYVGPFAFDIGTLIASLMMSWVSHTLDNQTKAPYATWILSVMREVLVGFEHKFLTLWNQHPNSPLLGTEFLSDTELLAYQQHFMKTILQQSFGFAGCEMARRQLGVAGVEDIRGIKNESNATLAEKRALAIARTLVVNYAHLQNVDAVEKILHQSIALGTHPSSRGACDEGSPKLARSSFQEIPRYARDDGIPS